ncbi:MAG: IclR family transcriptional regulator [Gammaproteobacteria bacterium]|jgi:DNA-binding IclR family transcriptional regulator|nr:IclR family transcriptional regulator [Gammaproteobacteria bacterium]|tara:strand:+ start:358 stop:1176 length:819 start_codon:yes stop_codon:yes gene_type:complete
MGVKKRNIHHFGQTPKTTLKGLNRALDVLEYIATHPGRATDIADSLEIAWPTLHRTVSQLEAKGFLRKDPVTNFFSIGPRMWLIGTSYLGDHEVLEIARPHLDSAAEKYPYTLQMCELSGHFSVVLFSHNHMGEEITKAALGFHFPLHCGSKGQVLLAYMGEEAIENYLAADLEALTPKTITDADELRAVLAAIRMDGYRVTSGDVQSFTASIATPVFNRTGAVVATLCFISQRSTFRNQEVVTTSLEALQRISTNISVALGWKPGKSISTT